MQTNNRKSEIFKLAWQLAWQASMDFGGNTSEYFNESLKMAYATVKTHCKVSKQGMNFSAIRGFNLITTPEGKEIEITQYILRTRSQYSEWIFSLAKEKYSILNEDEIAILINLSNQKF